eukprot:SAG22_NODE_288_length_12949_cov_163.316265_6_plen_61_part_00
MAGGRVGGRSAAREPSSATHLDVEPLLRIGAAAGGAAEREHHLPGSAAITRLAERDAKVL